MFRARSSPVRRSSGRLSPQRRTSMGVDPNCISSCFQRTQASGNMPLHWFEYSSTIASAAWLSVVFTRIWA
jgi:hypothetical protein